MWELRLFLFILPQMEGREALGTQGQLGASSLLNEVVHKKVIAGLGIILFINIKKMYSLYSFPSELPTI